MDDGLLDRAAQSLAELRLDPHAFEGLDDGVRPRGIGAAYAVQDLLHGKLTAAGLGPVVGHKIGCTTPVMQDYMDIPHPCSGGIFQARVYETGAALSYARFHRPGVECEMAVTLAGDLPPDGAPYDRRSAAGAVASCHAAIEVVDNRYRDITGLDTETLIADDFCNAACVLGPAVRDWRSLDLAAIRARTLVNGAEAGTGSGADVLGHPMEALAWFANQRAERGEGLKAGEFVLLGSMVHVQWLDPGDGARVEIEDLGALEVTFPA